MLSRRRFLMAAAAAAATSCSQKSPQLSGKQRVDRALQGHELDRPPFTFYYHFGLENLPGEHHARATLEFQDKFNTDLVKVMSDFPYPKPEGKWYELEVLDNPYPEQIRALEIIRDGLEGRKHFIETVFNPWNVAGKLSSKEEVLRLKEENPQALLDALEVIAKSEANHARRAIEAGAAGIFLAIANARDEVLTQQDYEVYSEPFDKMILAAVSSAPLNTLHLHGDGVYLDRFYSGWDASVIQYSVHRTGVSFERARHGYYGALMGGIDERNFRNLTPDEMKKQWEVARKGAGRQFILAPGCSVPNETTDEELRRFSELLTV